MNKKFNLVIAAIFMCLLPTAAILKVHADDSVSLHFEWVPDKVNAGGDIVYNIYLDSDVRLDTLEFSVSYDADKLELFGKNFEGILKDNGSPDAMTDRNNGYARFLFQLSDSEETSGYIGSLSFTANKDLAAGEYLGALGFYDTNAAYTDEDGETHDVHIIYNSGDLIIASPTPTPTPTPTPAGSGGSGGGGGNSGGGDSGNSGNSGEGSSTQEVPAVVETAAPVLAAPPATEPSPVPTVVAAPTPTIAASGTVNMPKTGDDARLYVCLLLMVAATTGLLAVRYFSARRR